MSILVVRTPDGNRRRVELSKNQPLTIGAHSISDIQIEEPGIELMEARISWEKKHFELTAANPDGVDLNGETVMSASLNPGDVLTLGETRLIFTTEDRLDESSSGSSSSEDDLEIGLAPLTEEVPAYQRALEEALDEEDAEPEYTFQRPAEKKSPLSRKKGPGATGDPDSGLEGDQDSLDEELVANVPMLTRGSQSSQATAEESAPAVPDTSALEKIRESLHASRQRPGEKEVLRSPLVMGLSIGSFFLLVGAVILWSVIGREKADRYLQRAREQAEQRKFQLAIDDYKTYLLEFPGDADVETANRELSTTLVRSKIDIGVPDWAAGLKELGDLVDRHRDEEDFERLHDEISEFAEQIAKGACQKAGREGDSSLFDLSDQALQFVKNYTKNEDRRDQVFDEVKALRDDAEASILKRNVFDSALAAMESALKQSKPFALLDARLDLIRQYEEAETDPRVVTYLQKALELEKSLVRQQREEKEADELPPVSSSSITTLSATSRISQNELPSGRPVYVHAADCLYGVDTATGAPIWRHVTGWNLPFFPIEVELGEPSVLLYAERDQELQLLSRQTGQLIWRQSLPAHAVGEPLIKGTQAFLSTAAGELLQIDLSTGTRLGGLTFSQPLTTSPLFLPETQHGLLLGERELAYLIELNPPAIVDVLYLGHGPGSVATDPLRMGPLVLIAENVNSESARLRVFDTRQKSPELVQIDEATLPDKSEDQVSEDEDLDSADKETDNQVKFPVQVIDAPVIRGNQLLVPSTPERVTAFIVSAESGEDPLTRISYFQVPDPRLTSTWLTAGPDGQVWMASSAVRLMHLTTESFEASPDDLAAVGIATQPIQMLGERMYVARRSTYGQAVLFSRLNSGEFSDDSRMWRTTLGDAILLAAVNSSGELITVHDSGAVFRVIQSTLTEEPFLLSENANVELPMDLQAAPFSARLSDGRFAMAWGGAEPKLSFIRSTGQVLPNETQTLPDEPQAAPVDLAAGVVVALPGRLHLVGGKSRREVKDFLLPVVQGDPQAWKTLTRLDDTHLLSVEDTGVIRRIEYREEPVLHLAEAGKLEPDTPVVLPPILTGNDRFVVVTEGKQLLEATTDSLQILSSRTLNSLPATAWKTGDSVYLQLQNDTLVCLEDRNELPERWNVSLARQTVTGQPLEQNETLIVPLAPQGVWILNKESGEILRKVDTPGACSGNPLLVEGRVVIPLADGSLYLLPEPAEGGDQL